MRIFLYLYQNLVNSFPTQTVISATRRLMAQGRLA
jgi:hypothetical protein